MKCNFESATHAPDGRTLRYLSMNIVNQLFDLAEVPVDKRQAINDRADEFVISLIAPALARERESRKQAEAAFRAAGRLKHFVYLKWEMAAGPDACPHGIAGVFSCRSCDREVVDAYYAVLSKPIPQEPAERERGK